MSNDDEFYEDEDGEEVEEEKPKGGLLIQPEHTDIEPVRVKSPDGEIWEFDIVEIGAIELREFRDNAGAGLDTFIHKCMTEEGNQEFEAWVATHNPKGSFFNHTLKAIYERSLGETSKKSGKGSRRKRR